MGADVGQPPLPSASTVLKQRHSAITHRLGFGACSDLGPTVLEATPTPLRWHVLPTAAAQATCRDTAGFEGPVFPTLANLTQE